MNFTKDSVFNRKFETESELIDGKKYFKEYHDELPSIETCQNCFNVESTSNFCQNANCKNDEFCRNFMGISQDELNELKKRTSTDYLQCDFEMKLSSDDNPENILMNMDQKESAVSNTSLISVQKKSDMHFGKSHFSRLYYKYSNHEWSAPPDRGPSKWDFDKLPSSEYVVCVKIYYPFISSGKTFKLKLLQEIHILGSQTLAQLKDKILCSFDFISGKDISIELFLKDVGFQLTAKDEYPSSFIFIENTFYNDTRTENHKDLSKDLRKWAAEKKIGNFQTGKMESTKLSDLTFSLGKPYVYQHQGNCEHLIIFSDMRLLDPSVDPIRYSSFPRVHCTGRTYGKRCMMCSQSYAKWLVIGNERLTHEQAYLCKQCYLSYNYVNGQKLGNFKAFNYVDPVAIL